METSLIPAPVYNVDLDKLSPPVAKKLIKSIDEQAMRKDLIDMVKQGAKVLTHPIVILVGAGVFLHNSDRMFVKDGRGLLDDYTATTIWAVLASGAAFNALAEGFGKLNPFD